jgi:hypothetical protein
MGRKEGFGWAKNEVGKMAGWAAFLLIPFFFSGNCFSFSFLAESFQGKEEGAKEMFASFATS